MGGTWAHMTAAELGREIGAGRIHPVELAEAVLDAIDTHPLAPRIYARTTPDRARAEAMERAREAIAYYQTAASAFKQGRLHAIEAR